MQLELELELALGRIAELEERCTADNAKLAGLERQLAEAQELCGQAKGLEQQLAACRAELSHKEQLLQRGRHIRRVPRALITMLTA